jgi:hypothetical protein
VVEADELDAEPDQVVEGGGVDVAGDDRDEDGVAADRLGGAALQPGAAVAAGHRRRGAVRRPPGGRRGDPLALQRRPAVQRAQLAQRHVHEGLDRVPGPVRQQIAR